MRQEGNALKIVKISFIVLKEIFTKALSYIIRR